MELKGKGDEAVLDENAIKQLKVIMTWNEAIDFDLAALYEAKDGREGMVYFSEMGDLNGFPFMKLDKDAGVGDTGSDNQEKLVITKLGDMAEVHLFAWDFGSIKKKEKARFRESSIKITIIDDNGNSFDVTPDAGDLGNVCSIAFIDNTSAIGPKLINETKAGFLKDFTSSSQFWDIVKAS